MNHAPVLLDRNECPYTFLWVFDIIGQDYACCLLWHLPGINLEWIPEYIYEEWVKCKLNDETNIDNTHSLSRKYNLTPEKIKNFTAQHTIFPVYFNFDNNKYLKAVKDKCGEDTAEQIMKNFRKMNIYIPYEGRNLMTKKLVIKEFNGNNHIELALKYQMPTRAIYAIMKEYYDSKKIRCNFTQLSVFD